MDNKHAKQKPMKFSDWAPNCKGLISASDIEFLTEMKKPVTQANATMLKPISPTSMHLSLQALKQKSTSQTPSRKAASTTKKNWNSSVKVNSKCEITEDGKVKCSVRKSLYFQPRTKAVLITKKTIVQQETPIIRKPDITKVKKATFADNPKAKISGISRILDTPQSSRINRKTIANKENEVPTKPITITTPKSILRKKKPDNSLTNSKSSDASFLRIEKEVNEMEDVSVKQKLIKPLQLSSEALPSSTPYKDHNGQSFFNYSDSAENNSLYNDNTIMSFSNCNKSGQHDSSSLDSLCDFLQKTAVINDDAEAEQLFKRKVELKQEIANLDNVIEDAIKKRLSVINTLQDVIARIERFNGAENARSKHLSQNKIKINSPKFKIPKKTCHQRSIQRKSLSKDKKKKSPNVTENKALNIYMDMKKNLNFLNTPSVKRNKDATDTPARMSKNLQTQLDKLYNNSIDK